MFKKKSQEGAILILAIWALSFLTIFAVYIGLSIRQRIVLLSRLEHRSQLHYIAEAGVKKAIAALKYDLLHNSQKYTIQGKAYRHNNVETFQRVEMGNGFFNVTYPVFDDNFSKMYGFIDEESKININTVDVSVLQRLFMLTVAPSESDAMNLAQAIINWREIPQEGNENFFSDSYYANLTNSYETKKAPFEMIDELLLVRGFNNETLEKIKPFVTVYGEGRININTAPRMVLLSLGLFDVLVDKILFVRRSNDGIEATMDDHIFNQPYDVASEMQNFVKLEPFEVQQIDLLNSLGIFTTNSFYFLIQSEAFLESNQETTKIASVYDARNNKILYWREK